MPRKNRRNRRRPPDEWRRQLERRVAELEDIIFSHDTESVKYDRPRGVVVVYGHAQDVEKEVVGFDDPVDWREP